MLVAVYGPSQGYELPEDAHEFRGPSFEDQTPEVSFEDRLKVPISAQDDMKLGDIVDQAAAQLGVSSRQPGMQVSWIMPIIYFFPPGLPLGTMDRAYFSIRTTTQAGQPSWDILWQFIRVDELLASSRAGLIDGDPRIPCLWLCYPQGGAGPGFWADLVSTWNTLQPALDLVGAGLLASEVIGRIRKRLGRAEETLPDRFDGLWTTRLGRPQDLLDYLSTGPRTTEEVAGLLGCQPNEAEAVLWSMGFVARNNAWTSPKTEGADADTAAARIIFEAIMEIRRLGRQPSREELEALIKRLTS